MKILKSGNNKLKEIFRPNRFFIVFILLIASLTFLACYFIQPVASHHLEPRMDANEYEKIYFYFKNNLSIYQVKFPFHSRVLVPYLASLVPTNNVTASFQLVNLILGLSTIFLMLIAWEKLKINKFYQLIGFSWLIFHWSGLVRLNMFDPIAVDMAAYFFEALLLIIILYIKWHHLLWIGPLATLAKEQFQRS